jgi:hypothetical protein
MSSSTICFFAQFVGSKVGVNSLTVTWDIERITRADGTRAALVTGGATNITVGRRGLYGYYLAAADLDTYDYVATAITASTAVDQQEIAAVWTEWVLPSVVQTGDAYPAANLALYRGAIWYSGAASNTNTVVGVDGIPTNPVSSFAAVQTLMASTGYSEIRVKGTLIVDASISYARLFSWSGVRESLDDWVISGGTNLDHCNVFGIGVQMSSASSAQYLTVVDGYYAGESGASFDFVNCIIVSLTAYGDTVIENCRFAGIVDCTNIIAPAALGASQCSGDITLSGVLDGQNNIAVDMISGEVTLDLTCTGGTVTVSGSCDLVDGSDGTTVVDSRLVEDQIIAAAAAALEAIHLDHLLAVDYDPAAKPGVATALLNELVQSDGGVSQFTANALELGPVTPAGLTAQETADAVHNLAPAGSPATGSIGKQLDAQDTAIGDLPTNSELTTALGTADDAVLAAIGALNNPAVSDVADAVLEEMLADHEVEGSVGHAIAVAGQGPGRSANTYVVTDHDTGLPLSEAVVWVTTDVSGLNVKASGVSDDLGRVTFWLTAGVMYYVWRAKGPYKFDNPDVEVAT